MELRKVIATLLFPMLLLSACSTLTAEEYLDAVSKEEVDVSGGIEKGNDKSLSVAERKENIDKRLSLLEDSKKLSAPSEWKDAHKEYVKKLELEIENLEKAKKNLVVHHLYLMTIVIKTKKYTINMTSYFLKS
ncbi:hypothetical protein ACT7DF_13925 [Bacillus cereus]